MVQTYKPFLTSATCLFESLGGLTYNIINGHYDDNFSYQEYDEIISYHDADDDDVCSPK